MKKLVFLLFLAVAMLLTGCEKIQGMFSGQASFLESMEGRWKSGDGSGAFIIKKLNDQLVAIDEVGW